jgi:hypothetical protein
MAPTRTRSTDLGLHAALALGLVLASSACHDTRCNIDNCRKIKQCQGSSFSFTGEPSALLCLGSTAPYDPLATVDTCPEACLAAGGGAFAACAADVCSHDGGSEAILATCASGSSGKVKDPLCVDGCQATRKSCDMACENQHAGNVPACQHCGNVCGLDEQDCLDKCPSR